NKRFVVVEARNGHVDDLAFLQGLLTDGSLRRVGIYFENSCILPKLELRYNPGAGLGSDEVGNPPFSTGKTCDFLFLQTRPDPFPYLVLSPYLTHRLLALAPSLSLILFLMLI